MTARPLEKAPARYDWPVWTCSATCPETGRICGLVARWKERPIRQALTFWLRCEHHKSARAERIAVDEPFSVVRLDLRIAVCAPPGDRRAGADDAVRRVLSALEELGAVTTGLHVAGGRASAPASLAAVGRLQLAGPPEGRSASAGSRSGQQDESAGHVWPGRPRGKRWNKGWSRRSPG